MSDLINGLKAPAVQWLDLTEAVAFLSYHGVSSPQKLLGARLQTGELTALGFVEHRYTDWGLVHDWNADAAVPASFWTEWHAIAERKASGALCEGEECGGGLFQDELWYRKTDGGGELEEAVFQKVEYPKVSEVSLRELVSAMSRISFEATGGEEENASQGPLAETHTNEGGRPAKRHGEAIAAATLRLSVIPMHELNRYTAASLARELKDDYKALGEAPPSERNRETYAAGILKVLRARET